jgi:hypothetical protein
VFVGGVLIISLKDNNFAAEAATISKSRSIIGTAFNNPFI